MQFTTIFSTAKSLEINIFYHYLDSKIIVWNYFQTENFLINYNKRNPSYLLTLVNLSLLTAWTINCAFRADPFYILLLVQFPCQHYRLLYPGIYIQWCISLCTLGHCISIASIFNKWYFIKKKKKIKRL